MTTYLRTIRESEQLSDSWFDHFPGFWWGEIRFIWISKVKSNRRHLQNRNFTVSWTRAVVKDTFVISYYETPSIIFSFNVAFRNILKPLFIKGLYAFLNQNSSLTDSFRFESTALVCLCWHLNGFEIDGIFPGTGLWWTPVRSLIGFHDNLKGSVEFVHFEIGFVKSVEVPDFLVC